jgi:3-phosphoshikimate 1-carboxyvinyltransferase
MNEFAFCGEVPPSKSLLNRWLLLRDYAPTLQIEGESNADDVQLMKEGLKNLHRGSPVNCGAAGMVLRFLCLRASRLPGTHVLSGTNRLMARPHTELFHLLEQLNVPFQAEGRRIIITGGDWQLTNQTLVMNPSETSQFASAVLLNCWNLPEPLTLQWQGAFASQAYFRMSLAVAAVAGMTYEMMAQKIFIPAYQKLALQSVSVEADLSSTFALAAIAVVAGAAEFVNFPYQSVQPDLVFVDLLQKMNVRFEFTPTSLKIFRSPNLTALHADLNDCPDLFPVLAVLCARATGTSRLTGAAHLRFKESDRLKKTTELLDLMKVSYVLLPDGLEIEGQPLVNRWTRPSLSVVRSFDPDQDHRLAMAAHVANWSGAHVEILNRQVVNKSFPGFWDLAGVVP